eukprot:c19766_g1_i3.p1 GENE.c19766_g1_i3~~c19766_g1_i3.p1  ORF type:complete len:183 (+),score=19.57 c19766_g1_i3:383-931(+)
MPDYDNVELTGPRRRPGGGIPNPNHRANPPGPAFVGPRTMNWMEMTPLHLAVIHRQVAICQLLIEMGADLEGKAKGSKYMDVTPLQFAILLRQEDIFRLLVEMGANLEAKAQRVDLRLMSLRDLAAGDFVAFAAIDRAERRRRLRVFLLGTLGRFRSASLVSMLPVDILGVIASQVLQTPNY